MKCVGFSVIEIDGETKRIIKVRDISGNGVNAYITKEDEKYLYFTDYYDYKCDKETREITMCEY